MATIDPLYGDPQWSWTYPSDNSWEFTVPVTVTSVTNIPVMPLPSVDVQELMQQIQEVQEALRANKTAIKKAKQRTGELAHLYQMMKFMIFFLPEPQRGLLSAMLEDGKDADEATGQLLDLLEESGVDVSSLRK